MEPGRNTEQNEAVKGREIKAVVTKRKLKEFDEKMEDLQYWLGRPAVERVRTVTFLVTQSLKKGQRMDKSIVVKKQMKP